eukprot:825458-Prymnesium_polylepis.1
MPTSSSQRGGQLGCPPTALRLRDTKKVCHEPAAAACCRRQGAAPPPAVAKWAVWDACVPPWLLCARMRRRLGTQGRGVASRERSRPVARRVVAMGRVGDPGLRAAGAAGRRVRPRARRSAAPSPRPPDASCASPPRRLCLSAMSTQTSKKRKFVADGVFFAELNELLTRELAEDGYSGVEVRVTPMRTEVIIRATRTQNVLGDKGRRIRELTSVVQKRWNFAENSVELYAEKVANRGLCAVAQCESLRYKLIGGLAVRRACYGVVRFVMESGAKGVECVVAGKIRGARAKSMKFTDGYMIKSGEPKRQFVDTAVRHVALRQGMLGVRVTIMLPWDPTGKTGPKNPLPDQVVINDPKEEQFVAPTTSVDPTKEKM